MTEYITEYPFSDPQIARYMAEIIRRMIRNEIQNLPYNRLYPAEVVSVGSGVANIKLLGGDKVIPNVKVRPGLSLSQGQKVYILAINGSLNNIIIDF